MCSAFIRDEENSFWMRGFDVLGAAMRGAMMTFSFTLWTVSSSVARFFQCGASGSWADSRSVERRMCLWSK